MTTYEITLMGTGYQKFVDTIKCFDQTTAINIMMKKWPGFAISGVKALS